VGVFGAVVKEKTIVMIDTRASPPRFAAGTPCCFKSKISLDFLVSLFYNKTTYGK